MDQVLRHVFVGTLATLVFCYGLASVTLLASPLESLQTKAAVADFHDEGHSPSSDHQHDEHPAKSPPANHCHTTYCVPNLVATHDWIDMDRRYKTHGFQPPLEHFAARSAQMERDPPVPRRAG